MTDRKSESQPVVGTDHRPECQPVVGMAQSLTRVIEESVQLIHEQVLKAVKCGNYSVTFENKGVELDFYICKMKAEKFPYVLKRSEEILYKDNSNKFQIAEVDKRVQTLFIRPS